MTDPTDSAAQELAERHGDFIASAPNGDEVRMHLSRFHGIVVSATRTYVGGERRSVSAYAGSPSAVLSWLLDQLGPDAVLASPAFHAAVQAEVERRVQAVRDAIRQHERIDCGGTFCVSTRHLLAALDGAGR